MSTIDGDSDVNKTAILILLGVHDVDGDWNLGECGHLLHLTEKDVAMPFVLNCILEVGCPVCFLY